MLRDALPKINTALPGPKSKAVIDRRKVAIPNGIGCPNPCVIDRGEGAALQDLDGNIFLDWVGGIGVLNLGYCNPEVVEAIQKQSARYLHSSINVVHYEEYIALAEKLNQIVPVRGDSKKTVFVNSGGEAVENAVKIARRYTKKTDVIVFTGAFHGRTNLTMAMTAKVKPYKFGMGPFASGIYRCEYPYLYRSPGNLSEKEAIAYYLDKLERMFLEHTSPETTAAVVLEPVQGEGGFISAPIEYIKGVREICDRYDVLLVADEVQSGYCRTGKMFATKYWEEAGVRPDLMTSAKSIAAGMPLSAVTGRTEIMDAAGPGEIGGTYCGNPVSCAAALKVIEIMERDDYAGKAVTIGEKCVARFNTWKDEIEIVGDVRAVGAMMALEFVTDKASKTPAKAKADAIVADCIQNGLITMTAGVDGNSMRFLMPLCITDEQLETGLDILEAAIRKQK